jgi:ribosomal-protein-alanine N-acetyltransferase
MIVLETARLTLRHFEPGDLDALYGLYRDPEIRRHFPDGTRTLEQTREELDWFREPRRLGLWATILRDGGAFIGRCGLIPWTIEDREEVEVAYMIGKPWQRRGFATEAARALIAFGFDRIGLDRIIALIAPEHAESIAVAERAGLAFERTLFFDGVTSSLYAIERP